MARAAIIVAHEADIHAHAVRHAIERCGARAHVVDIQAFTRSYDLVAIFGRCPMSGTIVARDGSSCIDLNAIDGLWWRRPYPLTRSRPPAGSGELQATVVKERRATIMGVLDAFVGNAFNDPGLSRRAAHKPTQLVRARQLGLAVPETLLSNRTEEARAFVADSAGEVVYKMLTGTFLGAYGTRHIQDGDLERLDRLATCPAVFQEYVRGDYDVRAIVVGDEVFAGRIDYAEAPDAPDTRFVPTKVSPLKLPNAIAEKLVRLVQGFGLVYSAVDLRFSRDRGYVFFESNPDGQFLWIEVEADQPISAAIARRLVG